MSGASFHNENESFSATMTATRNRRPPVASLTAIITQLRFTAAGLQLLLLLFIVTIICVYIDALFPTTLHHTVVGRGRGQKSARLREYTRNAASRGSREAFNGWLNSETRRGSANSTRSLTNRTEKKHPFRRTGRPLSSSVRQFGLRAQRIA